MASFYIWETVDFPIQIKSGDGDTGILEDCKDVIISFGQDKTLVEKDSSSPDISIVSDEDIVNVHLSQEDTGQFNPGKVIVQMNILYEDSERDTSSQVTIKALPNLHKGVMS